MSGKTGPPAGAGKPIPPCDGCGREALVGEVTVLVTGDFLAGGRPLRHRKQFGHLCARCLLGLTAAILADERLPERWAAYAGREEAEKSFAAANGIPWKDGYAFNLNKAQIYQWSAWAGSGFLEQQAAAIRPLAPGALIVAGTYFGASPFPQVVEFHAAGDVDDFHCYSRYAPGGTNNLLPSTNRSVRCSRPWLGAAAREGKNRSSAARSRRCCRPTTPKTRSRSGCRPWTRS